MLVILMVLAWPVTFPAFQLLVLTKEDLKLGDWLCFVVLDMIGFGILFLIHGLFDPEKYLQLSGFAVLYVVYGLVLSGAEAFAAVGIEAQTEVVEA